MGDLQQAADEPGRTWMEWLSDTITKRPKTSLAVGGGILFLLFCVWSALGYFWWHGAGTRSRQPSFGEFGDAFAPMTGAITAFGLVLTACALALQRAQLKLQAMELSALKVEIQAQVEQAKASTQAITAQQHLWEAQLADSKRQIQLAEKADVSKRADALSGWCERLRSEFSAAQNAARAELGDEPFEQESQVVKQLERALGEIDECQRHLHLVPRECSTESATMDSRRRLEGLESDLRGCQLNGRQAVERIAQLGARRRARDRFLEFVSDLEEQVTAAWEMVPQTFPAVHVSGQFAIQHGTQQQRSLLLQRIGDLRAGINTNGQVPLYQVSSARRVEEEVREHVTSLSRVKHLVSDWKLFRDEKRAATSRAERLCESLRRQSDRVAVIYPESADRNLPIMKRYLTEQKRTLDDAQTALRAVQEAHWYPEKMDDFPATLAQLARAEGRYDVLKQLWDDVRERLRSGLTN